MKQAFKIFFPLALFAFLFVACIGDPETDPSTNINNPIHVTPTPEPEPEPQPEPEPEPEPEPDPTPTPDPDPQDDGTVDLGLSVCWASCNVGASKPEEYGDYYAWAEIEPYYSSLDPLTWKESKSDGYGVASYRWYGDYPNVIKYCPAGLTNCWDNEGDPDGITIIDPDDDAATVTLGSPWRIPTEDDWEELISGCTWTWTTLEGVAGFEIAAPNGNSIFLPAAGFFDVIDLLEPGNCCEYWSSTLNTNLPENAIVLHHYPGYGFTSSTLRYHGCPIRPVKNYPAR